MAIISDTDAWAVGGYWPGGQALIEHWDGTSWTISPTADVALESKSSKGTPDGGLDGGFYGVAAIASDDVWVVGDSFQHWDGTAWSLVLQQGRYFAVAAIATNDVWAVGSDIRHWDGTSWSVVPSPTGVLADVAAISANDIWAVGSLYGPSLIVHWDGTTWSEVTSPVGNGSIHLSDVSARSATDVWAAGYMYDGAFSTLVEHWDGSSWQIVASPDKGTGNNFLDGILALSSNDVWAVGHYEAGGRTKTLVEHWNGTAWSIVSNPNLDYGGYQFFGIGAINGNDIWAVGIAFPYSGLPKTLIERYNPYPCPPTPTPTPGVIACGPEWHFVTSPDVEDAHDIKLVSVDAISGNDAWSAGFYWDGGHYSKPLIEHWDGNTWNIVPSPVISPVDRIELYSIAAISSNDVWVVGSFGGYAQQFRPLVWHWNGSAWSVVSSADPGQGGHFAAIGGLSANDVWAVGSRNGRSLIEHWNGSTWTNVPSPNPSGTDNRLYAVIAISSNDAWAVGTTSAEIIALHWNGSVWAVVPTVNPGPFENSFASISAISSNDVWAVGAACEYNCSPLIEHWNGSAWSVVQPPTLDQFYGLTGVTAISSNDVWAVGYIDQYPAQGFKSLTLHWDGNSWSVIESPNTGTYGTFLYGVTSTSNNDVWAVGYSDTNIYHDLHTAIMRYSLVACPPTPTPEPPRCPSERFTDVCPGDYFYQHVLDLNDIAILSGYNTSPPCTAQPDIPCFKPYNPTSRGQIAKVVSLSAGFSDPVSTQTFADVPIGSTFYEYIERMSSRSIIIGYPCGSTPSEPCDSVNRAYFRPGNAVNRAQLAKMTALAFGFNDIPSDQTFEDVVPDNHFYPFIENLASRGVINGYACGDAGAPCVPPENRPYFRYGNPVTRGQIAKIVNLARLYGLPAATPTPGYTATFTPTPVTTPDFTSTVSVTVTPSPTSTVTK